jgi:paraquat-inducible protein A
MNRSNADREPIFPAALFALWFVSAILLSLGLTRPLLAIDINIEGVIRDTLEQQPIVGVVLQERGIVVADLASKVPPSSSTRQSIVSSTIKLFRLNAKISAVLILVFSIVMPICKQVALLLLLILSPQNGKKILPTLVAIHKWAMLDVFVLSSVVLALSSGSSWNATLLDGFYWFLGYFIAAAALGRLLARRRALIPPPITIRFT